MRTILLAGAISLIVALLGTPVAIRVFTRRGYGQEIRSDGPAAHQSKRGTPTMGGTVILIASLTGYLVGHGLTGVQFSPSGLLVMFLMTGLGIVGFLDDFIKLYMQRSLGLRSGAKLVGQAVVGVIFAILALRFPDGYDLTPASTHLSFLYDFGPSIGAVLFVVWVLIMVTGTSNAVNLTDGLDGLATGASILVLGAYVIIGIWQLRNDCTVFLANSCYQVRDPLDVAVVASSVMGACFGFLWWNAPPAKIFMGDTGSLALGGVLAGLAIVSRTELLLILLGGLFIVITMSVVIQVGSFKLTGKRVFRMAPLQHHFELAGWAETTIVVRFWLIAGMMVALGLAIFYVGLPGLPPCPAPPRRGPRPRSGSGDQDECPKYRYMSGSSQGGVARCGANQPLCRCRELKETHFVRCCFGMCIQAGRCRKIVASTHSQKVRTRLYRVDGRGWRLVSACDGAPRGTPCQCARIDLNEGRGPSGAVATPVASAPELGPLTMSGNALPVRRDRVIRRQVRGSRPGLR